MERGAGLLTVRTLQRKAPLLPAIFQALGRAHAERGARAGVLLLSTKCRDHLLCAHQFLELWRAQRGPSPGPACEVQAPIAEMEAQRAL